MRNSCKYFFFINKLLQELQMHDGDIGVSASPSAEVASESNDPDFIVIPTTPREPAKESEEQQEFIYLTDQYGNTRLEHDPTTCDSTYGATTMGLMVSLTPTLAAAVTPLNYAQYQFIYPEDNQLFGMSFNTNVNIVILDLGVAGGSCTNGGGTFRLCRFTSTLSLSFTTV